MNILDMYDLKYFCSECGEQLETEDIDELYGYIYIKPCENCLENKEEE